ncbi:MAG: host attachment protein [Gammaproteobacteria bacterium]|nr:host attachment protein [Gammaproteobacteria bacterium]
METRVIVADNARARIFASHSVINRLQETEGFVHPEAHLSNRDLVGDSSGKSVDQRGSLDPATSAKEQEAQNFAKMLARHLRDMHNQQHFEQLILIAPPRFLGMLRKELPKPLAQLVTRAIDKDLTTASTGEIIDYIKS